jgi:hypothetical protein
MTAVRLLIVVAVFSAAVALLARDPAAASMLAPDISLSLAPGVSVPKPDELAIKLQNQFRTPAGTRTYVRENDRWVEVKPLPMAKRLDAVVRSYNSMDGTAYVYFTYPQYRMPFLQIWRFDGKVWGDSVDPGIFVR